MTPPRYIGVQSEGIPSVPLAGSNRLHLVSGEYADAVGPIRSLTDVFMSWADLAAGGRVELPTPPDRTALLYIIRGEVTVDDHAAKGGDLVRLADNGDTVGIEASSGATVLFSHGDPIGEPITAHGPFVMNTEAEIRQAFRDYRAGLYGKPPAIAETA